MDLRILLLSNLGTTLNCKGYLDNPQYASYLYWYRYLDIHKVMHELSLI